MKLDSLLASSTTVLDHSFAFEPESQPFASSSSSNSSFANASDQPTNSQRAWEPWNPTTRKIASITSLGVDPFTTKQTESSNAVNGSNRSSAQITTSQPKKVVQPLVSNTPRVLPPPVPWNMPSVLYKEKPKYAPPISQRVPASNQRYAPTFHSIRQTLADLESHLAQVRSYPELLSPNGDQLQVKTHEQIHSTLITLYHSNSAAQESSRSLTFTYNLYVEAASFLRFLPHPITPFKLLSLSLLLLPSPLGEHFRRVALPPGSENKLKRFQIRPGTTLIYCIEEVIEVCGMLSGWYAASNWECREQWSMWETELRQEEFAGIDYALRGHRDRQPQQSGSSSQAVDSAHSNLSATRPRGSISSDPQGFATRPLLNARSSVSLSSPVKTSYFYPPSPDSSTSAHQSHQARLAARTKPRSRPIVKVPSTSTYNSTSTSTFTSTSDSNPNFNSNINSTFASSYTPRPPPIIITKPYIPSVKGVLPLFRRPPTLPPIIAAEEFSRHPNPTALDVNRSIATSRPKRLGPLEMIAWSDGDSSEEGDSVQVGKRVSKRPRRAVSRDSSHGYDSSDFE